jgi:hypothetical protein
MLDIVKKVFKVESIKSFYSRYEGIIGGITLIIGFIVDNLTVSSVTMSSQTYIFIVYILMGGIAILGLHYIESKSEDGSARQTRAHFWLFLLFQFAIGSLFSMYFAFYSRGVSISTSWPFLLILFGTMLGSELWKKHYLRLSLQVSLYFVAIFSFSIYVLPIIFHEISTGMFLLGGILSLVLVYLFVWLLKLISKERVNEWQRRMTLGVGIVYILLNILYFTNTIPPVPLFMRQVGVHHTLHWDGTAHYIVTTEKKPWWNFLLPYPVYHHAPSDPVYVMAAVYAPTALETVIVHEWQYYNDNTNRWESRSKVRVPIVGGREGGYRTYSMKQELEDGLWRVDVKTAGGRTIGRVRFKILNTDISPQLVGDSY